MKRISAAVALAAAGALVISGCAAGGGDNNNDDSGLVEGSSITAAWNQAFYSMNGNTSFGNATANNNINYLVLDGFNYYNNVPELVQNTSFGSYEVLSEDPLTVKYTIADGVKWSDGTDVKAGIIKCGTEYNNFNENGRKLVRGTSQVARRVSRVGGTIPSGQGGTDFSHVEEGIVVPAGRSDVEIIVSLSPGGAAPARGRRR